MNLPILTHTRRSTFRQCPYKHYLRFEVGIVPIEDKESLRFGTSVHTALDMLAQGQTPEAVWQYEQDRYAAMTWGTEWDRQVELAKVLCMVTGYLERWQNDPIEYVATEQVFEAPITNPETGREARVFCDAGKIDKVISDGTRIGIMEHKTTTQDFGLDAPYWKKLRLNTQISGYMLRARELGYDVSFVLYDVIRKPELRPKSATPIESRKYTKDGRLYANQRDTNEDITEYAARLQEDIAERPEHYFARKEIPRLDMDLRDYEADLWSSQKMIRFCQVNGYWPKHDERCEDWGGCEYQPICFNGMDPKLGDVPDGFKALDCLHPELQEITA